MVYDAFGKLVAEYGETTEDTFAGIKYVFQDWQGSVRAITNSNGYVISRTDHQAFGEQIGSGISNRHAYLGYQQNQETRQGYGLTEADEGSGQQHTWFRKLETQAGRWTGPDPYKGSMELSDPQSFNRFAYVANDPVNFIDPSGLCSVIYTGMPWDDFGCGVTVDGSGGPEEHIDLNDGYFKALKCVGGVCGGGGESGGEQESNERETDCQKFARIVQELADKASSIDDFLDKLIFTFTGATNTRDFKQKAGRSIPNEPGRVSFGPSDGENGGFQERIRDGSNQARHYVGGFIAVAVAGIPGFAYMQYRENSSSSEGRKDRLLNGISGAHAHKFVNSRNGDHMLIIRKQMAQEIRDDLCSS